MADLFGSAPIVAAPKKSKRPERSVVDLEGFSVYAAAKSLLDGLTAFMKPLEVTFKDKCRSLALEMSAGLKKPESFNLLDGCGKALFALKKLTTLAPLSADAQAKFTAFNVPFNVETIKPELYFINPDLLADATFRNAISEALSAAPALQGQTIIMRQEKVEKATVSEKTIEAIMKMSNPAEQALLSSMAQTPAFSQVKFEGSGSDAIALLESVGFSLLELEEEEAE